jgi:hypothetical protein
MEEVGQGKIEWRRWGREKRMEEVGQGEMNGGGGAGENEWRTWGREK